MFIQAGCSIPGGWRRDSHWRRRREEWKIPVTKIQTRQGILSRSGSAGGVVIKELNCHPHSTPPPQKNVTFEKHIRKPSGRRGKNKAKLRQPLERVVSVWQIGHVNIGQPAYRPRAPPKGVQRETSLLNWGKSHTLNQGNAFL